MPLSWVKESMVKNHAWQTRGSAWMGSCGPRESIQARQSKLPEKVLPMNLSPRKANSETAV